MCKLTKIIIYCDFLTKGSYLKYIFILNQLHCVLYNLQLIKIKLMHMHAGKKYVQTLFDIPVYIIYNVFTIFLVCTYSFIYV